MTKRQLITAITDLDTDATPATLTKLTKAELEARLAGHMAEITADVTEPAPIAIDDSTPDRTADAPDLLDMAKAASVKPTKAPKPKTVHAQHPDTNLALCTIDGLVTSDEALVTCKICLAKIHGIKPVNAISDETKAARKQFASFKARIGYMMYMDRPANSMSIDSVSWSMGYTNSALVTYSAVGSDAHCKLTDSEGNTDQIWVKGDLDDAIAKLGWEA